MTNSRYRIGVDLGGTKISAIIMGPSGTIEEYKRIDSPQNDYEQTISAIRYLVSDIAKNYPNDSPVGVGIPGSLSPATNIIQNANSTWLNGKQFDRDLAQALNRPVRIANDANCFALSEAIDGAGRNMDIIFGVILGTGCGGAIVIKKQLINGPRGIAGEWGHNPLPWPEPKELQDASQCWCGQWGCIETWISGPGFSNDHYRNTGFKLSAKAISKQAAEGHKDAQHSLERLISRIARGLAAIINTIDPDAIILGGGLSQIQQLYKDLPEKISPYIFCDHSNITILPPYHGDDGGVRGAAWLWN